MLTEVLRTSKFPDAYFEGLKLEADEKYEEATAVFKNLLKEGFDKKDIHHHYVVGLVQIKAYDAALDHLHNLVKKNQISLQDYPLLGEVYFLKGDYAEAVSVYNKYLYKYFEDVKVLLKRGIAFIQISEYQRAVHDFSAVIARQPDAPRALCQRALAHVRLGKLEDAREDLEKSKAIDANNPTLYLHYGYYYKEKNDRRQALENFTKAKALGVDFHGIDYLIATT
ncbi:MAG: tetratricopeptide repeat protein, partial [Bacteroidota bacterium]